VLLCLEVLEEAHNVLVSRLFQDDDFVEHFAPLRIVTEILLIDALDSDHLARQVMHSQINFAECALAQDLANSIEVHSSPWHLTRVLIGQPDVFAYLFACLLLGGQLGVVLDRTVSFNAHVGSGRALFV